LCPVLGMNFTFTFTLSLKRSETTEMLT